MGKTFQNIKLLKYYVIQLYKMLDAVKVTRLEVKVYSPVCFTARISCTYELRRIEVADSRIWWWMNWWIWCKDNEERVETRWLKCEKMQTLNPPSTSTSWPTASKCNTLAITTTWIMERKTVNHRFHQEKATYSTCITLHRAWRVQQGHRLAQPNFSSSSQQNSPSDNVSSSALEVPRYPLVVPLGCSSVYTNIRISPYNAIGLKFVFFNPVLPIV